MLVSICVTVFIAFIVQQTEADSLEESGTKKLAKFIWSSCQWDTPWTKGSGPPIQSWLQSIVYYHEDAPVPKNEVYKSNPMVGSFEYFHDKEGHHGDTNTIGVVSKIGNLLGTLQWKKFGPGFLDGWLYGNVDASGHFTGNDIAYIYADLTTVIYGTFDNGILIKGRERKVKGFRCKSGLMELQFSRFLKEDQIFMFEEANETFITSQPTVMDPLDRRNIYISNSTINGMVCGDGIYAKRNIPANTLVAVYAGVKVAINYEFPANFTLEEREDHHKNLLSYNSVYNLDIPPPLDDIVVYRATLGHKFNHDFEKASADFCYLTHPRFGSIRCMKSLRPIKKGEEIFINYNYDTSQNNAPSWYQSLEEEYKRKKETAGIK